MKKFALTEHEFSELLETKGIVAEVLKFATNKTLSIDDRVAKMDLMLSLIDSHAKASPDNGVWDELYTGHQGMMQFWEIFRKQRSFFSDYAVTEIEEVIEEEKEKIDEKTGKRTTEKVRGVDVRTVDSTTAIEMWLGSPAVQDPQNPPIGSVNILRTVRERVKNEFEDLGFTREFAEECVESFGEIAMIRTILLTMNYGFHEFPETVLLIQPMMAQTGATTHLDIRTEGEPGERQ